MSRVLVTGVRGRTGLPLAELLAARPDVEVLGGSSDPAPVAVGGVRPTAFSWDDPAGLAPGHRGRRRSAQAAGPVRPGRIVLPPRRCAGSLSRR